MGSIRIETFVPAPPGRVYAALLDPKTHARTASGRERVVGGGSLLRLGDEVTFEATHFLVRQRLTARITLAEPPPTPDAFGVFEDTMVRGFFRSLWHRHEFHPVEGGTRMVDHMTFRSPLGEVFDRLVLAPYLRRFLERRGIALAKELSR